MCVVLLFVAWCSLLVAVVALLRLFGMCCVVCVICCMLLCCSVCC